VPAGCGGDSRRAGQRVARFDRVSGSEVKITPVARARP
jgi:hypothetical protein